MRYLLLLIGSAALLYGQCNQCTTNSALSPTPFGFNPEVLSLLPGRDTTLVIYFTFPDAIQQGSQTLYPNYAIWVDSLKLDVGLITRQNGQPFTYVASDPSTGPIHFNQMHRYKQWGSGTSDFANFVVYQNPGGSAGNSPPIGCARVCIRTSNTEGSDTLRVKVRAFITGLGDAANKDTSNLRPTLLGNNAWLDTVFRYPISISRNASLPMAAAGLGSLSVAPNPAITEATLHYTLLFPSPVHLRAYSLDGREVFTQSLGLQAPGEYRETLRLPAGHYMILLETARGVASTRLAVVE